MTEADKTDPVLAQIEGMLVATADHGDAALDDNVHKVLATLRRLMNMDVVFVSKFEDGRRVFKVVETAPEHAIIRPGDSSTLEQSWCYHIVNGRLPGFIQDARPLVASGQAPAQSVDIGTHLSVPVVLKGGQVFGTLCAFALYVNKEVSMRDIWRMRAVAELIARRIDPA